MERGLVMRIVGLVFLLAAVPFGVLGTDPVWERIWPVSDVAPIRCVAVDPTSAGRRVFAGTGRVSPGFELQAFMVGEDPDGTGAWQWKDLTGANVNPFL